MPSTVVLQPVRTAAATITASRNRFIGSTLVPVGERA
jgi:hypothetical protein